MSINSQIRLQDILQTKFKAKALQEKVYIEYNKVKADTWDRRNMRVEFNPNKLSQEEMLWLKQNILEYAIVIDLFEFIIKRKNVKIMQILKLNQNIYGEWKLS